MAVAIDGKGTLYLSLDFSGQLTMIDVSDPPVLSFAATAMGWAGDAEPDCDSRRPINE
jgi:hypothetical protein